MFTSLFTRSFVSKIVAVALLANLLGSTGVTIEKASADAMEVITEAQAEADSLQAAADMLQITADSAQTFTDARQVEVDSAQALADAAQTTADTLFASSGASIDWLAAQQQADSLQILADGAQDIADAAQISATAIQDDADAAQALADAAQVEVDRLESLPDLEPTMADLYDLATGLPVAAFSDPASEVVSDYFFAYLVMNNGEDVVSADASAAANTNIYGDTTTFLGTYNENLEGDVPTDFLSAGSNSVFAPLALTSDASLDIQNYETLTFCVDEDELVEESDETNNCLTVNNLLFGASADAVTEAQAEVDVLQDLADGFQSDADAAQEVADDLQSVADAAQATADSAQAQADSLQSSGASVEDVTGAQAVADDLQLVADAAQATADSAQAQADSLQSTADAAQDLADAAQAEESRLENLPDLEITLVRFTSDTDGDGTTEIISTISDPASIVVSEYNIPYQLSNTGTGDVASTDGAAAANVNVYGDADTDNFLGTYNEDFFGTIPTVFLTAGSSDFFFPLALTNDALLSIQDFEFLTFCVDEDELVEEADETNNCLTTVNLLYVEPDAVPVLTIEAGSDQTVTLGDTVTLSGLVSNNVIDSSISSEIVIDWGDSSSDETISATLSGVDNVFTSSGHTYSSIGLYPVIVIVTGDGSVTATDTFTVTVNEVPAASTPDLVIDSVTLNEDTSVSFVVRNAGTGEVDSANFPDLTFYFDFVNADLSSASLESYEIDGHGSDYRSVDGTTTVNSGSSVDAFSTCEMYVLAVVDGNEEVTESDDSNNEFRTTLDLCPEVAVAALTLEAGSDQTITVGDTVTLSGLGSNVASSQVTAIIDWGDPSSDDTISATISGTDYVFTSSAHTYSEGLYTVTVTVTDGVTTATDIFTVMVNEVPAASTPTVTTAADMDITDISMDPLTGMISYTAANLGNLAVNYLNDAGTTSVYLNYGESDETPYVYQWQTEMLAGTWLGTFFNAEGSETINSGVSLSSGEHRVMVCIERAANHGEIASDLDNCEIETFQGPEVVAAVVPAVTATSTSGGGGGGGGSSSGRGGSSGGGGGSIYAQNEEDDDEDEVELAEEACAEAMSFTDVSEGDDMYEYIYDLWCREVVEGKDLYTYAPEDDVTRAEFLKIALLNAGYSEDSTGSESFSDVSAEDWFYNYVLVGVEMGIIEGYEDGSFRPNSSINRAEALIILMRVAGMDDTDASGLSSSFSDVDSDDWYASAVFVATANGVVEGYPDGTFMPGDAISRAEVAAMAVRSL